MTRPRRRADLIEELQSGPLAATVSLDAYRAFFNGLPPDFCARVNAAWGDPESDVSVRDGAFAFRFLRLGKIVVALAAGSRRGWQIARPIIMMALSRRATAFSLSISGCARAKTSTR